MYSKNFLFFLIFTAISFTLCNQISAFPTPTNLINEVQTTTLQMVQIIIRHGDRAPIRVYPNDPHTNESLYWPNGLAQLTQIGIKQQIELGKYFRNRYDGFLPKRYSRLDFVAESSDVDRAIQSAEANLGGLYPSIDNNSVAWQVVPIHTIPRDKDIYLDVREDCPRYVQQVAKVYWNITQLNNTNQEFGEFIELISQKAGVQGFIQIMDLQDTLKCEKSHNFSMPDWATSDVLEKLDNLRGMAFKVMFQPYEMKRIRGGPLIEKLLENFQMQSDDSKNSRKMHLFSGHDLTLAAVLSTWDIFDAHIPGYASALMIELHKNPGDSESNVHIYYRNETNREPYNLIIPKCGSPCLLSKLIEISNEFIPTDWEAECLLKSPSPFVTSDTEDSIPVIIESLVFSAKGILGFVCFVGAAVVLIGLIQMGFVYCKEERVNKYWHHLRYGINSYETLS